MGHGDSGDEVVIRSVVIKGFHGCGLSAREAARIVQVARKHDAKLAVRFEGKEAAGQSMLSLLALGAPCGARLELVATGSDAQALSDNVAKAIDDLNNASHE